MGVVFRNGRPFGAAKEDVTVVTNFEDLTNLSNKETNHLYVTTSDSKSYYYDITTQTFKPLTSNMVIPGNEDQIVAANGHGNAKPNSGYLYSKMSSIGENFSSASLLESKLPAMKIELAGTSSTEDYWGNSHSGILAMTWNPLMQLLGDAVKGSPVFSMRGKGIIDIESGNRVYGTDSRSFTSPGVVSHAAMEVYEDTPSPFIANKKMNEDNLIYPYLSFKQSSTLMMTDMALIQAMGGSSLLMDGNIDVRLRGSGVKHGSDYLNFGSTQFWVDPGSIFKMATDDKLDSTYPYTDPTVPEGTTRPLFLMQAGSSISSQILMSTGLPITTDSNPIDDLDDAFINQNRGFFTGRNCGWTDSSSKWVRSKVVAYSTDWSYDIDRITQPTFIIQGQSNVTIGGSGKFGCRICSEGKTMFAVQNLPDTIMGVKIGAGEGAESEWEILQGPDSQQFIKFGAGNKAKLDIAFEPMGINSLKFSPEETCGISFTPKNTDLCCQWGTLDGVIDCSDVYIFNDGLNRIELRDDAVIHMKGTRRKYDQNSYEYTASNSDNVTIITNKDYTGMTVQDLSKEDYENFTKPLQEKSKFSVNKWYYKRGGDIVSTEYYADRYYIVMEGFGWTKDGSSKYYCFHYWDANDYTYNFSTMYSWTDFQNWLHRNYGPNATVTNGVMRYVYSAVGGGYDMYFSGTINNIQQGFNSETQYDLNTVWNDISSSDQSKILKYYTNKENSIVVANDVRTDMKYNTIISAYTYSTGRQNGEDWAAPVQCRPKGPVFQLYDSSNICMRDANVGPSLQYTYMLDNPTETYDFTQSQYEVITQFLNSADYTTFLQNATFESASLDLSEIISLAEGDDEAPGTKLFITYTGKWKTVKNHVDSNGTDPIIEMVGPSELRLYGGATIKAITEWDKTTITFSGTENEGEVSFTIDELRALKNLLT